MLRALGLTVLFGALAAASAAQTREVATASVHQQSQSVALTLDRANQKRTLFEWGAPPAEGGAVMGSLRYVCVADAGGLPGAVGTVAFVMTRTKAGELAVTYLDPRLGDGAIAGPAYAGAFRLEPVGTTGLGMGIISERPCFVSGEVNRGNAEEERQERLLGRVGAAGRPVGSD